MSRPTTRVVLAFVLVVAAFAVGLTNLERIFVRERQEGHAAPAGQRELVLAFTQSVLRYVLHERWVATPASELRPVPASQALGLTGPTLTADSYWERAGAIWLAAPVDAPALLRSTASNLIARGMLAEGDDLDADLSRPVPLSHLALTIRSPRWEREDATTDRWFWIKTTFVGLFGVLVVCLAALAVLDEARRLRYVELKSGFVSAVSHELRTPLASIRVLAETLEQRLAGTPGARDYPTRIVHEADHLSGLVENILSFNRLDKGRWMPRLTEVSWEDILAAIRAETTLARSPVELVAAGTAGPGLRADPELMRLLFANLARNACRYNARNPVRLSISVEHQPRLRVLFSDNGTGVPPQDRERIFGEFERGSAVPGRPPGTGLGLALCRRIMRLHRGRIRLAESGPEGSTFELEFA